MYVTKIKFDFLKFADDGTPPDIDYLWENYDTSVICRRARGYVCVKYSYIYNSEGMYMQLVNLLCSSPRSS